MDPPLLIYEIIRIQVSHDHTFYPVFRLKAYADLGPALNVNIGPSSSALLMKNSCMFSKFRMNGKDPTRGKDGIDGGYLRLSDFFLRALVKIETVMNVGVKKRISVTRGIFSSLGIYLVVGPIFRFC